MTNYYIKNKLTKEVIRELPHYGKHDFNESAYGSIILTIDKKVLFIHFNGNEYNPKVIFNDITDLFEIIKIEHNDSRRHCIILDREYLDENLKTYSSVTIDKNGTSVKFKLGDLVRGRDRSTYDSYSKRTDISTIFNIEKIASSSNGTIAYGEDGDSESIWELYHI